MERSQILDNLTNSIEKIVAVIIYGNLQGKDRDVFVLCDRDIFFEHFEDKNLDIICVGKKHFLSLVFLFDPLVIEPLLTGELIYGEDIVKQTRFLLGTKMSNNQTVAHLRCFSTQIIESASRYCKEGDYYKALVNIVFALSYDAFSSYYQKPSKAISFKQLMSITDNKLLKNAHKYLKSCFDIESLAVNGFLGIAVKELAVNALYKNLYINQQ